MRGTTAESELLLLRAAAFARAALGVAGLVRAVVVGALAMALADSAGESYLVVGVFGTLLVAWAVARHVALVLPAVSGVGPVVAARDHHRALARRPVPRHLDPDAPGHTRARAPSQVHPAV